MANYTTFRCPWMETEDIHKKAEETRSKYDSNIIPIDSELIIEKMGISIIPTSLPKEVTGSVTLAANKVLMKTEYLLDDRYLNPFRFACAHEIGHLMLHNDQINWLNISSLEEYFKFQAQISTRDHDRFEYQASEFAGRLLVPKDELNKQYEQYLNRSPDKNSALSMIAKYPQKARKLFAEGICGYFQVSKRTLSIRLEREGLIP